MKALVLKDCFGEYDDYYETVVGVYLVEDNIDVEALRQKWRDTASIWKPVQWKNQHGSGVTQHPRPTISFIKWLKETLPNELEIIEVE